MVSATTVFWILGSIITVLLLVIGGMFGLWLHHTRECSSLRVTHATEKGELHGKVDMLIREMGDHKSGMRGWMHDLHERIGVLDTMVQLEKARQEGRDG